MFITLLAAGSRGDTQPFVALGVALKEAGYGVRVAAPETFENFIQRQGLEFYAVAGDVRSVAANPEISETMQADNPLKIIRSFNVLKNLAFEMQKDLFAACQGSDAIIYHPGATIGYFAARSLGIPSILASPFPMTPTGDYPALVFYNAPRLGRGANFLSHKLFEQILWRTSSGPVKKFWRQSFDTLPQPFSSPFIKQQTAAQPTLVACSNHIFPKPNDWPEHVHNTGYWFLDEETTWEPPEALQAFLEQGPPPVYAGFGSVNDPKTALETTHLVIETLRRTGQRGVLARGWNGMTHLEELPEHIFMLESAPHAWLFPRMAAVIHHGGAGTTAAGFRAGVPSILIPHSVDQFAWGQRASELGVGPTPIPKKKLSGEKLAAAISQALTEKTKVAARDLGQKIQDEKGLETAVRIINQYLQYT